MTTELPTVTLPGGERVPALGQGTWHMGEDRRRIADEAAAVRLGIELGMTLIDTAEMYGGGGAEEMVARAAEGVRDDLFIVSKVYPHNASRTGVRETWKRSESCSCRSTVPGSSSPETIASSITSARSSAFVVSVVTAAGRRRRA